MNLETIELAQTELKNLAYKISDEELEKAGTATDADAASSLWTSFSPAGCTCVVGV